MSVRNEIVNLEEYCRMLQLTYNGDDCCESCSQAGQVTILKRTPFFSEEYLAKEIIYNTSFSVGNISLDIYPFVYPKSWELQRENALKMAIVLASKVYNTLANRFEFLRLEPHRIFINWDKIYMQSIRLSEGFGTKVVFGEKGIYMINCERNENDCPYISICKGKIFYNGDKIICNGKTVEKTDVIYRDIYAEIMKIDVPATTVYRWIIDNINMISQELGITLKILNPSHSQELIKSMT
jgi:hypothetical protein